MILTTQRGSRSTQKQMPPRNWHMCSTARRSRRGPDGSPCFTVLDEPLPFGGLDLDRPEALARGLDQAPEIMDVAEAARQEMQR